MLKYLLLFFLCAGGVFAFAFKPVLEHEGIFVYENEDKSVRVIKRKQKTAVTAVLDKKQLSDIAKARFKVLEFLKLGFSDFKTIKVYGESVVLSDKVSAYVWSGSYKNKKGKRKFFMEFIGKGWTYNVFVKSEKALVLSEAVSAVKSVL